MNGQEIAGFLGVILGAVLTYSLQALQRRSQRKEEQKTASMLVAIQLRSWLTECDQAVLSHLNHESTGGEMGAPLSNLPSTNFEQYFDQVARLGTAEAKSVFDWIHKTKEAKRNYDYLRDAVDGEIAEDQLLEESGVLFSSGLKVYKALTNAVGWSAPDFSEHSLQRMSEIVDRADARRAAERDYRRRRRPAEPAGGSDEGSG